MAADFSQTTRSLRRDSPRLAIAAWCAAGVFVTAWTLWFTQARVGVYEVSTLARVEVASSPHPVTALAPGKVVSSQLEVGREVQAGDILAVIDGSDGRLRLEEVQQHLDALSSREDAIRREIASRERARVADANAARAAGQAAEARRHEADTAATFAVEYEQKTRQLQRSGLVAALDLSKAVAETKRLQASRDAAAAEVQRLEQQAEATLGEHDAAIEALRHTLASLEGERGASRATAARLSGDLDRHVIRAPISGRLGDVATVRPGAFVTEGQVLAQVVPTGDLMVVADFDPAKARGRVRPGQQGQLRLDGFPWAQYGLVPVTVTRVSSEARQGLLRIELAIGTVPTTGLTLEHGAPGRVELRVEDVSPATLVLRAAGLQMAGRAPVTQTASAEAAR